MTAQTPKTDAVATRQTDPNQSLSRMLEGAMPELRKIAPKYVNLTRMASLAIEAKMRNPLLANCSPVSVLNFCKKCAEAGTDRVGAGGMWAVPFWNNKTKTYDMTPIPDWRMLVEKAKKAKAIKHATAEAVYEADEFSYERGMEPKLFHKPARSNRGKIVAVYCVYTLPDDSKDFTVMDWEADILPIRNRTNAWKSHVENGKDNPWVTDEAEQGKKTVVKRALKVFEGASPELTALFEVDNVVNGFTETDLTPRLPVQMPRAIDTTATETLPPAAEPSSDEGEPSGHDEASEPATDLQDGQQVVKGEIVAVWPKDSPPTAEKAWKRYDVKIGDIKASTFDGEVGKLAESLKGKAAVMVYTTNAKGYHDIAGLRAAKQAEPSDDQTIEGDGGEAEKAEKAALLGKIIPLRASKGLTFKKALSTLGLPADSDIATMSIDALNELLTLLKA